jgi:hypothetical protein
MIDRTFSAPVLNIPAPRTSPPFMTGQTMESTPSYRGGEVPESVLPDELFKSGHVPVRICFRLLDILAGQTHNNGYA